MQEHAAQIRDRLGSLFREIETTRMDGVPILNPALEVAAFGFEPWQDYYLGVLLTPWFMNLVLLPRDPDAFALTKPKFGDKQQVRLPAGQVEFIVGHEEDTGFMLSCSLFSPVFEFDDQAAAEETALAALEQVLAEADADEPDEDADMRAIWAGELPDPEPTADPEADSQDPVDPAPVVSDMSRRDLLRGSLTGPADGERP